MIDRSTAVSGGSYPRLFEAGRMRDLALANRLIMAPMESNLAMPDGSSPTSSSKSTTVAAQRAESAWSSSSTPASTVRWHGWRAAASNR